MKIKLFEIRDSGTFIPALAIKIDPRAGIDESEFYLIRRSGWGTTQSGFILCRLECSGTDHNATYDPYSWSNRSMHVAHLHIEKNWDQLMSGDVIDVQFILGETKEKKLSERLT